MVRLEITLYRRLADRQVLVEHTENQYFASEVQALGQLSKFDLVYLANAESVSALTLPENHYGWSSGDQVLIVKMVG